MDTENKYGPLPQSDSAFKRRCRLLQSWYRVEILGIDKCGPWRKGSGPVGSSLIRGEISGANFLSPEAFAYAKRRAEDSKNNPDMTVDEFRLFNNMLSSMPMCFNLFSDFRAAAQTNDRPCTEILGAIFRSSPISRVAEVVIEMIPQPTCDYIDDKTAWDAAIFYLDGQGNRGLASIETKYTDKLGGNRGAKESKKLQFAKRVGIFTEQGLEWYTRRGFDQVARNLLLTLAYADKHNLAHATNYVLAPKDDNEAPAAVSQIKNRLAPKYQNCIEMLALETVVQRGLESATPFFAEHLTKFRQRYLDFDQIAHL